MRSITINYKQLLSVLGCCLGLMLFQFPAAAIPMLKLPDLWQEAVTAENARQEYILQGQEDLIALLNSTQGVFPLQDHIEEVSEATLVWDARQGEGFSDSDQERQKQERKRRKQVYNMNKQDPAAVAAVSLVDNYAVSIDDVEPRRLAEDAKRIFASIQGQAYASHNTLLCVSLKDSNYRIKKFMFANTGIPKPELRKAADDLYYHSYKTYASHAEGAFIQKLWQSSAESEEALDRHHYTHLVGMGCSRPHCKECNAVLKCVLGGDYEQVTAAASGDSILVGQSVVDRNKTYSNYYIPTGFRAVLEAFTHRKIVCQGRYNRR